MGEQGGERACNTGQQRSFTVNNGHSKTGPDQGRNALTRHNARMPSGVRFPPAPRCDVARHPGQPEPPFRVRAASFFGVRRGRRTLPGTRSLDAWPSRSCGGRTDRRDRRRDCHSPVCDGVTGGPSPTAPITTHVPVLSIRWAHPPVASMSGFRPTALASLCCTRWWLRDRAVGACVAGRRLRPSSRTIMDSRPIAGLIGASPRALIC